MPIKIAVAVLALVCAGAPLLQTFRFRRFGHRSPWHIPVWGSLESFGWLLVLVSIGMFFVQGVWVLLGHPWYSLVETSGVPIWLRLAGFAIGLGGSAFSFWSQMQMGSSWRVGTDAQSDRALVTTGAYRYLRNPIYLGLLGQFAGAGWLLPSVMSLGAFAVGYLGLRVVVFCEERFLCASYGESYRDYMARSGRFLPRWPKSSARKTDSGS